MKSPAYVKIKPLVSTGYIQRIADIAKEVGMKTLQDDLGMGNVALNRRFKDPEMWTIGQLRRLAELTDMPLSGIVALVEAQLDAAKKKPKKK